MGGFLNTCSEFYMEKTDKGNPLTTAVLDSSIFLKILKNILEKKYWKKILLSLAYCNDEIIINIIISKWVKSFLNYLPSKTILLNILQNVGIYLNILFCPLWSFF